MRQAVSTIEGELRKAGVANSDAMRRSRIAGAIYDTGAYFGEREAARLRAHFAKGYVGEAAVEAFEAALLDGSWVVTDANLREQERERGDERRRVDADTSGMEWVSESNPYGWAKPEQKRSHHDHDVPGAWNAFRQALNLTAEQRAKAGARDHRVRGCTRWDVVGKTGRPRIEWDQAEADAARNGVPASAITTTETAQVYGEATK